MLVKFHVKDAANVRQFEANEKLILNPFSAVYRIKPGLNSEEVKNKVDSVYNNALVSRI
jgi:hypothetical protein